MSRAMDDQKEVPCPHPTPDPFLDEEQTGWCDLHSLSSLKLTLDRVIQDCILPHHCPLEEFPLATETEPPTTELHAPLRALSPRVNLSATQLALKSSQLKLAAEMYQKHIQELSQGSKGVFGVVRGESVCLLVDTSDQHCWEKVEEDEEGEKEGKEEERRKEQQKFSECRENLQRLFEEQLIEKTNVYILQFGSDTSPSEPPALNFKDYQKRCMLTKQEWLDSLKGSGSCNLLGGLRRALDLPGVDTVLLVLGSRPDQDSDVLVDYMVDRLTGSHRPLLHLVAHHCDKETTEMLSRMATETNGHFHKYSPPDSVDQPVEDTDISRVRVEIKKAEVLISELERVKLGQLPESILKALKELCMVNTELETSPSTSSTSSSSLCSTSVQSQQPPWQEPVSSTEWLKENSLEAAGLSIYKVLAPNAYSQLETHVETTDRSVTSTVYDEMMPLFTWRDGSQKYLNVDIHLLQEYQHKLEVYITKLFQRLNWLASGSRVPFGTVTEKSVLLLLECSTATQSHITQLQAHLQLLLTEQLAHVTEFNIIRFGGDICAWQEEFVKQIKDTLSESWAWLLGMSPDGKSSVMAALKMALEDGNYTKDKKDVGIYLVTSSMPNEDMERICSYLQDKTADHDAHVHVVYYRHVLTSLGPLVATCTVNTAGGCYGNEQEITHCLEQVAKAGGGKFHSFRGPNEVEGDDIDLILAEVRKAQDHLKMARKIVEDYREFCRRHVPPSPVPPVPSSTATQPPPLYPRPTSTFIVRMNANSRRIAKSVSDTELYLQSGQTTKRQRSKHTKTSTFHLDPSNKKGILNEPFGRNTRKSPRKPHKEESISSVEWLSKYGLKSLGLSFSQVEVDRTSPPVRCHRTSYKHVNKKGEVVELYMSHQGLKSYVHQVSQARRSYQTRLEILSRECHQHFGCITESKVLFLIDISSSMAACYEELVAALTKRLEDRPQKLKEFNLIAYSSCVYEWQEQLVPCSSENVVEAAEWLSQLRPGGCSCLLDALKTSLQSKASGIYLITDGTADHTHDFLLSQIPQLRKLYGHTWRVNTIAFHCSQEASCTFLKNMAHKTGGRYHSYPWAVAASSSSPAQLLQNNLLGDDLKLIAEEIMTADDYLLKASNYL